MTSYPYPQSVKGWGRLMKLDRSFLGKPDDYMGIAYFWSHEYKHYLRDVSEHRRRLVHAAFVREGLALAGKSDRHEEIVLRYCEGRIL